MQYIDDSMTGQPRSSLCHRCTLATAPPTNRDLRLGATRKTLVSVRLDLGCSELNKRLVRPCVLMRFVRFRHWLLLAFLHLVTACLATACLVEAQDIRSEPCERVFVSVTWLRTLFLGRAMFSRGCSGGVAAGGLGRKDLELG
jgi:hypothetical protein